MFSVRHVSVYAGAKRLLEDLSFDLRSGELLTVVGPNGAGKSTLLKVMCGDVSPGSGEVSLEGRPLARMSGLEQARRRAVLPQDSPLSFPFSAFEVALMGRNPHHRGAEGPRDYEIARAALEAAGALDLADRLYPTLSGGEKQRVQLARVMAQVWEAPPSGHRYLLLDEPTSSLDLAHQHSTLRLAKRFTQGGAGVLAVLHDLNLAAQYADRILVLSGGRAVALGSPQEVLTPELIARAFNTPVLVTPHPCLDCPLVVSASYTPDGYRAEEESAARS